MAIKTWFECTNLFRRRIPNEISAFQEELTNRGYSYSCKEVYLGKKGLLISPDGNIIIKWFFTERDGIYLQVKCKQPYRILFEYFDGSYFINDDREEIHIIMSESKLELDKLRKELMNYNRENAYCCLERVIMETIVKPSNYLTILSKL